MDTSDQLLSIKQCSLYSISKETFTEMVLLAVIAYFCVSTEQRFINMARTQNSDIQVAQEQG